MPIAPANTVMAEALIEMTTKSFGCVGLTEMDGRLIGIVTDGDLRRHMNSDLLQRKARDVMTSSPRTIEPGILAAQALALMNELKITSLFAVEDRIPVGILHIHDCLRAGIA
jgi:arabinose-5-phosphate isomerase